MNRPSPTACRGRVLIRWALSALLMVSGAAVGARAQTTTADINAGTDPGSAEPAWGRSSVEKLLPYQSDSTPLGCAGCGGGGGCASCGGVGGCTSCGGPGCVPGRLGCCEPCEGKSMFGRLVCGLHSVFCCPDPCYEPCYVPAANAAMFQDSARPVTQMSFHYAAILGGNDPTQGGYFWNKANIPFTAHDIVLDNEMAIDRFSLFVSTPFRIIDDATPGGGYADMKIGTKTLMVDTELLLFSFQFTTYIPTGLTTVGTGNGNVGLEPSFLFTLKVTQDTYVQAQVAEWIGVLNGSSVFHYHLSLDHTLTAPRPDMQLVGTLEFGSYVFPGGPAFYNVGPGARFYLCRNLDLGFGCQFATSPQHYFAQIYQTELRWRF